MYTTTTQGEEILNLHVRSQGNRSLTDSITVRALAGSGISEKRGAKTAQIGLCVLPNPVSSGGARICFVASTATRYRLTLHDVTGAQVQTIFDRNLAAGAHQVRWQPEPKLGAGVYVIRLQGRSTTSTRLVLR